MTVRIELVSRLQASSERAFDLSLDVELHAASMKASGESAIAGVRSGRMALGDQVTWRARHLGLQWKMTSRITEYERPSRFVDEQVRGPFARFRHEHLFREVDGWTEMTDRVELRAPFGGIGRLAEALVLRRYIKSLIETRNRFLAGQGAAR